MPGRTPPWKNEEIRRRLLAGESAEAIRIALRVAQGKVARVRSQLIDEGWIATVARRREPTRLYHRDEIIALRNDGKSWDAIGARLGIASETLIPWCRKLGVDTATRPKREPRPEKVLSPSRELAVESLRRYRRIKRCVYHDCEHPLQPGDHTRCTAADGNPACVARGPRLTTAPQQRDPFGWIIVDGAVHPHPAQWPKLAQIVDRLEAGATITQAAQTSEPCCHATRRWKRSIEIELYRRIHGLPI